MRMPGKKIAVKSQIDRDFPGGPVAKIPCSQNRRPGFDP